MQSPGSEESKVYFALQRKTILAAYLAANTAGSDSFNANSSGGNDTGASTEADSNTMELVGTAILESALL